MIAIAVAFGALVAAWGFCQRRRREHAARIARFDAREGDLHRDVDSLLDALAGMEQVRPTLEREAA